jgi:hypothetical protein
MVLMHQTYNHLQSTLTVPKVSDLVKRPEQKYKEINKIIDTPFSSSSLSTSLSTSSSLPPPLSAQAVPEMKDELKSFLTMLRQPSPKF